jgi:hypothetical protein
MAHAYSVIPREEEKISTRVVPDRRSLPFIAVSGMKTARQEDKSLRSTSCRGND